MNIIQKRVRKTFIYSIEHSIITNRKPEPNTNDHHEKSIVKQSLKYVKKQK